MLCLCKKMSIFAQKEIDMELTANNKKSSSLTRGKKIRTLALSFDPANKAANAIIKMIESCGLFDVTQEETSDNINKSTTDDVTHNADKQSDVWCGNIFPNTDEFVEMIKESRKFRKKEIDNHWKTFSA